VAFEQGDLDDQAIKDICRHLADCPHCEAVAAEIEAGDNGIVANLRRFHDQEPWIDREELDRLEAKIKAIPTDVIVSGTNSSVSEFDSGTIPHEEALIRRLEKYDSLHAIGRGGMGVVYAAVHTKLKRKVAIKLIHPDYAGDSRVRARFKREMEAIGKLEHTNIVAAADADEVDGHPFLVMQYVEGLNLDSIIRLCGKLPVAEACEVIRQAALGLQYIHEQKLVHRDLKPSNMMLSTDGLVKILDLGLALLFADEKNSGELTRSHLLMGTEDYMAPEQWEDSHEVDIRADIYSLGCTFYKLLVGEAPFSNPEYKPRTKKKFAHVKLAYPPIQDKRPDVPDGVAAALDRMLAKEPKDRYSTPSEVASALEAFAQGSNCRQLVAEALQRQAEASPDQLGEAQSLKETVGYKPSTPVYPSGRSSSRERLVRLLRRRWPVVAAVCVLAAGLGVAVALYPAPVQVDEPLVPGKVYHLLTAQRPPVPIMWRDSKFEYGLWPRPALEELTLTVPDFSLVKLGTTERAGYKFQVNIRQFKWVGGAGVFFGYHRDVDYYGKPCWKWQFLELRPDKDKFTLQRFWATLDESENGPPHRPEVHGDGGTAIVESPAGGQWCTLEITATAGAGVTRVSWNGTDLPRLSWKTSNSWFNVPGLEQGKRELIPFTQKDFTGAFGVIGREGEVSYGNARIMLFDDIVPQ
jgi:serine/threonine protein kinase